MGKCNSQWLQANAPRDRDLIINAAQAQQFIDVIGNPPDGANPVSGARAGCGANPNNSATAPGFESGIRCITNAPVSDLGWKKAISTQLNVTTQN